MSLKYWLIFCFSSVAFALLLHVWLGWAHPEATAAMLLLIVTEGLVSGTTQYLFFAYLQKKLGNDTFLVPILTVAGFVAVLILAWMIPITSLRFVVYIFGPPFLGATLVGAALCYLFEARSRRRDQEQR